MSMSWVHPLLFPESFHGTEIFSGLMGHPLREKSFEIFCRSFSSLDLSITGTPSTTRMLSKPSSDWTWYLHEKLETSVGRSGLANVLCFNVRVVDVLIVVCGAVYAVDSHDEQVDV